MGAICRLQVGISFHTLRWSTSCRATRRSTVFDNTDRFDIGLYDLQSAGSMSDFFSSGVMNADLNGVGNTPDDKDRLHSSVMNGASKSALSLRRHVGMGLCQRHTQTSLSHPPADIWRMLLFLAPDVTSCIVAALCSVCQSVSRVAAVSQSQLVGCERI